MERASTRLRALEVQTQLATQALSIANAAPKAMLHLLARQVA
jgi:flagellin-like hook-associated protein FlgL